jgi:hypothetical protein
MNKGALWRWIQVGPQVKVNDFGFLSNDRFSHSAHRFMRGSFRSVSVRSRLEVRFENWFQNELKHICVHFREPLQLRPDDLLTILKMALSIGFGNSISLLPAIQATRLLTFTSAGLSPTVHTCLSWSHNRT